MPRPKITFKISQTAEIRALAGFVRDARYDGGRNLEWGVYRNHSSLRAFIAHRKHLPWYAIQGYINDIYTNNTKQFSHNLAFAKKQWQKVESPFFSLVKEIFPDNRWPNGKYIAYGTIWSVFPRYLDDKTFYMPFHEGQKGNREVIIAHELLHFIFYDHLYRWCPEYQKPRYHYFTWHVSEIFNGLIQNSAPWLKVFRRRTMMLPEHKSIIRKIRTQTRHSFPGTKALTQIIIGEVKKIK